MGGTAGYSGFYQEPAAGAFSGATALPQSAMGYHQPTADYGQDARQTPGFAASAYNPAGMMYNVQQANAQTPVYDTSQQFSSRQPAAMQMMTPDVAGPYFSSEPTNAPAGSGLPSQAASSSSAASGVYQQPGYSSGMAAVGSLASQSAAAATAGATADVAMDDQDYPAAGGLDAAYGQYQTALREIFQNINNGVLATASESLLNVSDWLLSHVTELGEGGGHSGSTRAEAANTVPLAGLTSDDQSLHGERITLWNHFNHAWLSMLQKQKDMMSTGQRPSGGQTVIGREGLEKMGKELTRLCDGVERHGLVDYQYGVWEEQIIDGTIAVIPRAAPVANGHLVLVQCVAQYDDTREPSGQAGSSRSQR